MSTPVEIFADRLRDDVNATASGQMDLETFAVRSQAFWAEVKAAGLFEEVDALANARLVAEFNKMTQGLFCPDCVAPDGESIYGKRRIGRCDDCHGSGQTDKGNCANCDGTGMPVCCRCEGSGVDPYFGA